MTAVEADNRIGGRSIAVDVPTDPGVTAITDATSLVSTPALTVPPTVLLSARGWTPPLRGAGVELAVRRTHLLPPEDTSALVATAVVLEAHAGPGEAGTQLRDFMNTENR